MLNRGSSLALTCLLVATPLWSDAQSVKRHVDGVTNFTQVDMTMACAGVTKASAVPELARMGFKTVVNLQMPDEEGADVPGEQRAAVAAGLRYVHLPFTTPASPDENVDPTVDEFLRVAGDRANHPVFVHCAGGGRAAGMWMIKRVVIDGWDVARARAEATLSYDDPASAALAWAEGYARRHKP